MLTTATATASRDSAARHSTELSPASARLLALPPNVRPVESGLEDQPLRIRAPLLCMVAVAQTTHIPGAL
jgi:hypothetical protein